MEGTSQQNGDTADTDLWNRLGGFLEAAWRFSKSMRSGKPLDGTSVLVDAPDFPWQRDALPRPARDVPRLTETKSEFTNVVAVAEFQIEATSMPSSATLPDWRVTTTHHPTGMQHEYYVHEGRIHHVQFQAPPPWDHSTWFIVGMRVKRIMAAEKRAISLALAHISRQA